MTGHALILLRADRDIRERFDYLALEVGLTVARRFRTAVTAEVVGLLEVPEKGPAMSLRRADLRGLRRWPVSGFEKILIFYRQTSFGIEIVRVLHGAQDVRRVLRKER